MKINLAKQIGIGSLDEVEEVFLPLSLTTFDCPVIPAGYQGRSSFLLTSGCLTDVSFTLLLPRPGHDYDSRDNLNPFTKTTMTSLTSK